MSPLRILTFLIAMVVCANVALARDAIRIVGSSTAYPFAAVVAEQAGQTLGKTPILESTGTGGGIALFCSGFGLETPDIVGTSRRMRKSEFESCMAKGVKDIIEIKVGYDVVVLASPTKGLLEGLTSRHLVLALAARVPDETGQLVPNPYQRWSDIDPRLTKQEIRVYGPVLTSSTRDALIDVFLQKGAADAGFAMAGLESQSAKEWQRLRADGRYLETKQADGLVVEKLGRNTAAVGIMDYAMFEENDDRLSGISIDGVSPTRENIASGKYSGARPVYMYIKTAHIGIIPGLDKFAAELVSDRAQGADGYLAGKGLVSLPKTPKTESKFDEVAGLFPLDPSWPQEDQTCLKRNSCTPVRVMFGTNRQDLLTKSLRSELGFGHRGEKLSLGSAVITVPKPHTSGVIERPNEYVERFLAFFGWDIVDPGQHFALLPRGVRVFRDEEQFIAEMRKEMEATRAFKEHAFVFIHGYNTTFQNALFRAAQLTFDLGLDEGGARAPFGVPYVFSWPSGAGGGDGLLDLAWDTAAYATDTESARLAEPHLKKFLKLVAEKSGAKHVHLVAHSLGNQPLLRVLAELSRENIPGIRFSQIVSAAPDVDRAEFRQLAQEATSIANGMTVYASSEDKAIILSRRVHSNIYRAGDVAPAPDGPVVVNGVDSIDVSGISMAILALNHSHFAEERELLNDLALLIRQGTRPPHQRSPVLRTIPLGDQQYWRY